MIKTKKGGTFLLPTLKGLGILAKII